MICLVFLGYLLVVLSSMNFLGISKIPHLHKPLRQISRFLGKGALFTRTTTMYGFETEYRFYQNGEWGNWQQLEAPLFEEYITTGRLASLKHNRLDKGLSRRMNNIGIKQGVAAMEQSEAFKIFTSHLFYRHNQDQTPDSLAITYRRKYHGNDSTKVLLAFKCKP